MLAIWSTFWEQQLNEISPLAEKVKEYDMQLFDYPLDFQLNGIKITGLLKIFMKQEWYISPGLLNC